MIDFSHNHLKDDIDALLNHLATAAAAPDAEARKSALFSAGLRLMRLEKEIARMGDVIAELDENQALLERLEHRIANDNGNRTSLEDVAIELGVCTCHREATRSHELCCGHDEGRDPNCPFHGDGSL